MPKKKSVGRKPTGATDEAVFERIDELSEQIAEVSDIVKREAVKIEKEEAEIHHIEKAQEQAELLKKGKIEKFEVHDFTQVIIGSLVFAGPGMFTQDFWDFLVRVPTPNIFAMHAFIILAVFVTYYYRYFPFQKVDFSKLRLITKRVIYIYFPVLATVLLMLFMFNVIIPADPAVEFMRKTMIAHTMGIIGAVTFDFLAE